MSRVFNFSAGPCTLPLSVLEQAQREFVDYRGKGMSIIEMSHRSEAYEEVHYTALALARELAALPEEFEVLLLQGGATLQFAMVPLNLLAGGGQGAYSLTGTWAHRAFEDASRHGSVYAAWNEEAVGDRRAPRSEELEIRPETRYLHITSNETIDGLRYPTWPEVEVPIVADVSSEFLLRPLPWDRLDLVYGGVQKNLGPAGLAVVFVRRSVLGDPDLASYLGYRTHAEADSMFNTPPVFQIWMMEKVLSWIKRLGGVPALEAAAEEKARLVYDAIERSGGYYRSPVSPESRSLANVVFRLPDPEADAAFIAKAEQAGLVGLKGHRRVGGCRASLYSALPLEAVEALVGFMDDFQR